MAFGEAVAAEALELPEGRLGKFGLVAVGDHAVDELSRNLETPPVCLKVAMALRSWSASPAVKPAHTIATCMACS